MHNNEIAVVTFAVLGVMLVAWVITSVYAATKRKKSHDIRGDGFVMRHSHRWTRGGFLDHIPLEDPPTYRHTAFWVRVCDCDSWECYPRENRALLSDGAARELAKVLNLSLANEIRQTGR